MALSIIKRPIGYSLGNYVFPPSTSITSSGGDALFAVGTHGLSTGTVIYIYSGLTSYNGFWTITVISSTTFKLQNPTGGFIQYTNNAIGKYLKYAVSYSSHKWMCVHLPIIYQFQSTLWPTNQGGISRTVSSFANDSGYVKLTLSGALDTFNALNYVNISGANTSGVNGVWQIITKTSTSVITINLSYSAGYDFTNGNVIIYYNNYHASINVWSGLNASHNFGSLKPYKKVLNLNIIPDSNNNIKLNLNDYLKNNLNIIQNNLAEDTLPNNIDFMNQFYIEYAESYDQSDGTLVTTFTSPFTSDQSNFEGFAVNAKLPFKNRDSGFLTSYIYGYTTLQKFLTNFSNPSLFIGQYFDISFIMDEVIETASTYLIQLLYLKNVQIANIATKIGSGTNNFGIYRFSLNQIQGEDQQKIYLATIISLTAPNTWSDALCIGSAYSSKTATYLIVSSGTALTCVAQEIFSASIPAGTLISFNLTLNTNGSAQFRIRFLDNTDPCAGNSVGEQLFSLSSGSSPSTITVNITLTGIAKSMVIYTYHLTGTSSDVTVPVGSYIASNSIFSETKIIKIDSTCYAQNYYLTWLNPLGGFDYWNFTGRAVHQKHLNNVTIQQKNIFTAWPNSWGEFADTIESESKREAHIMLTLKSQNISLSQLDSIAELRSSPLVQLINDPLGFDKRTLLIDNQSFDIRKDGDKTFNIKFQAIYTDRISNQEL